MIPAGQRNRRIQFQRATVTTNTYNEDVQAWSDLADTFARIRFGSGQERREAAQESGSQAATFECNWTPTLATVTLKERILFEGEWDITSIAPIGVNREIHFTGVRAG